MRSVTPELVVDGENPRSSPLRPASARPQGAPLPGPPPAARWEGELHRRGWFVARSTGRFRRGEPASPCEGGIGYILDLSRLTWHPPVEAGLALNPRPPVTSAARRYLPQAVGEGQAPRAPGRGLPAAAETRVFRDLSPAERRIVRPGRNVAGGARAGNGALTTPAASPRVGISLPNVVRAGRVPRPHRSPVDGTGLSVRDSIPHASIRRSRLRARAKRRALTSPVRAT